LGFWVEKHYSPHFSTITRAQEENLAQPNYQYEKRQKDLAKKKKKEEKLKKKLEKKEAKPEEAPAPPPPEGK
jgi:septal ring factor EnvC (AmiA/AmiB activator)